MLAASTAGEIARIVLGVALVAAGVAKIAAGQQWTRQATAIGTPAAIVATLPWLELAVGASIASGVGSPWPSVIGVALVAAFTVWIVVQLVAGRRPPCACFGALSTAPLSWWHAGRNVVLIALGCVAVID